MLPTLIVFGDKTANEVLEAAILGNQQSFGCMERVYFEESTFSAVHESKHRTSSLEVYYNIGVADVFVKQQINRCCKAIGWKPFTVVHPSAIISPSARIGEGVFVGPLAIVSTKAFVGDHCIVHLHASIGHDAQIGEYSAILPGARISGSVFVGDRVLIGSNAFVNAGVRIGHDCQVDALTYVSRDLADGHILSVRAKGPMKRVARKE
ncbi:MAG TPA: DapH/DapD/GlmU-related protein [Pirellula sp.]|nr:DapH/DapD/GlmU-related protein [Pirellula sp.]